MHSLIWKQWRESRLLLILFCTWMVLTVTYSILYEMGHEYRAVVGSFSSAAMLYTMIAAIVLAVRVSQGERSAGTLSFTTSLPVGIRRMATVRIAAAVITLAIPLLVGAFILSLTLVAGLVAQAEPRTMPDYVQLQNRATASLSTSLEQLASVTAIAILGGVELMLILSLIGTWLRNQAQVGFLGAVLALGSFIAAGTFWYLERMPITQLVFGIAMPQSLVIHWSYGDQTGFYTDHELASYRWISLALAIPLLALIAKLFVNRYGSLSARNPQLKPRKNRLSLPTATTKLIPRLPNRLAAMVWLELRQSVPLAAYGLAFAILLTVFELLTEGRHGHGFTTSFRMQLPGSMFLIGMLWSVVVGSGLYSQDLDQKLGNFWRSRPISTSMWFWCKYVVGLVAVLIVLDGTTTLICWTAPRESMTSGMSWAYLGCFPVIHVLMYSLAVLGTCIFRRAVIGGILAVVVFYAGIAIVTAFSSTMHLEPMNIYNDLLRSERDTNINFRQHGYPLVYGTLAVTTFLSALLAHWFAMPVHPRVVGLGQAHLRPSSQGM